MAFSSLSAALTGAGPLVNRWASAVRDGAKRLLAPRPVSLEPGVEPPPSINPDTFLCVEMTDHCDLACRMCDQVLRELPHFMAKGFLPVETWEKILADLKRGGVHLHGLSPIWVGESLLHPEFPRMLRYAFDLNAQNALFDAFSINTNATSLTPEATEAILDVANRPDINPNTFWGLVMSIDATTPEVYARIKKKERLARVEENCRHFVRRQLERGNRFPLPILKFIVMEENFHEAKPFLERWSRFYEELGVDYQVNYDYQPPIVKPCIFFDKFIGEDPAADEERHRQVALELGLIAADVAERKERIVQSDEQVGATAVRRPCPALWKSPMVAQNGDVAPCCHDSGLELKIGNLKTDDFLDLWTKGKVVEYRIKHVVGDFDFGPCKYCPNQRHPTISDDEIVSYLRQIGRAELVPRYLRRVGASRV